MVTIAITNMTRSKLVTTTSLDSLTDEIMDGVTFAEGSNGFNVPLQIANYVLDQITVADTVTTNLSTTITSVTGFTNVKVGMEITGAGIPASTVVASITDINTIEMDQAATASATVSANFDFTGTVTWGLMNITITGAGSNLRVQPRLYLFDGSDPTNASLGIGDASSSIQYGTAALDLDSFLTTSGVSRVN